MKKPFFPLALGLVAAIAAPANASDINPVGVEPAADVVATLPAIAPVRDPDLAPTSMDRAGAPSTEVSQAEMPVNEEPSVTVASADPTGALNFEPPQSGNPSPPSLPAEDSEAQGAIASNQPEPSPAPARSSQVSSKPATSAASTGAGGAHLFEGGSQSVVARVVGAAEGTRTADGGKTDLYEGHVDPGNGVWNRGTFSYQFGNDENLSPDEADRRQMAKIQRIYDSVMLSKAEQHGVSPLTLSEELNGIDLINQAPLAVTESGGYIERLAEAKKEKGLSGEEAILDARVWAFWDPQRNGWDAPGLRAYDDMGKEASIRHDQQRRMGMIAEALSSYEQQHGAIARSRPHPATAEQAVVTAPPPASEKTVDPEKVADLIIFQSFSGGNAVGQSPATTERQLAQGG